MALKGNTVTTCDSFMCKLGEVTVPSYTIQLESSCYCEGIL